MTYIDVVLAFCRGPDGHATKVDDDGRRRHVPLPREPWVYAVLCELIESQVAR